MAGIYSDLAMPILGVVNRALQGQAAVITALVPLGLSAITVWVMWHGVNTMRGATGSHAVGDLLVGLARVMLVFSVGVFGGAYGSTIAPALLGTASEFARFFGVTPVAQGATLYQQLDATQNEVGNLVALMMDRASMISLSNPFKGLAMSLMYGLAAICTGLAFTLYLVLVCCVMLGLDTSLNLIVLLGPIFVFCLAFPKTESFFYPWFNTAISTAVGIAALFIPISLMQSFISGEITEAVRVPADESNPFLSVLTAIATVVIAFYLLKKLPQILGAIIGSSAAFGYPVRRG